MIKTILHLTSENVVLIVVIDNGADRYQAVQTTATHKLMHKIFIFLHRNTQVLPSVNAHCWLDIRTVSYTHLTLPTILRV